VPYAGEVARHRVITADGHDFVVATVEPTGVQSRYITAAYPVQHGYLVMVRQALCELRAAEGASARENHEKLVRVLAEAGVGVVRARRALAARRQVEHASIERERSFEAALAEEVLSPLTAGA
jgi:hypothetical protein